jgi:hypothetical protein
MFPTYDLLHALEVRMPNVAVLVLRFPPTTHSVAPEENYRYKIQDILFSNHGAQY